MIVTAKPKVSVYSYRTADYQVEDIKNLFSTVSYYSGSVSASPSDQITFYRSYYNGYTGSSYRIMINGTALSAQSVGSPTLNPVIFSGTVTSIDVVNGYGERVVSLEGISQPLSLFLTNTGTYNPQGQYLTYKQEINQSAISSILENGATFENYSNALYVTGHTGNDTLLGGPDRNFITGNGGDDLIQGGPGHDTATYMLDRSQYVITQTGSLTTVRALSGAEGTDTLISTEVLQFADQAISTARLFGDLNGDGKSDFVLQNQSSLGLWLMDGVNPISTTDIQSLASGWAVVGIDDVNGDGRDDLLLQNRHQVAVWQMDGKTVSENGVIGQLLDGWQIVGTGDVNGDKKADLFLQNERQIAVWELDGKSVGDNGVIGTLADGWQVAGIGDLNGDSRADLLLQNGQNLAPWYVDGLHVVGADILNTMQAGWSVAGLGDFDGNGQSDILLQNGQKLAPWFLHGGKVQGGPIIAEMLSGWNFAGVADMNGDHRSDIILQNANRLAEWHMNGSEIQGGGDVQHTGGGLYSATLYPGWELV